MLSKAKIISAKDGNYDFNAIGTHIKILISSDESSGQEFTFQAGGEGVGPPPHYHEWEESFYVLKGNIEFTADGETHICEPGTLVYIPGGTVHGFKFCEGGAEMIEITGTGSNSVQLFSDIHSRLDPENINIEKVIKVFADNEATVKV